MTAPTAACILNLDAATLSAWRDGLLPREEAARIAAHVASCAACQATLREYEATAAILRGQPVPDLRERVWRGTLARIERGPVRQHRVYTSRTLLSGVGAAAAVLLIVALFGALLSRGPRPGGPSTSTTPQVTRTQPPATSTATTSATATSTITTGGSLAGWHVVTNATSSHAIAPVFAPSNQQVGYLCAWHQTTSAVMGTTDGGKSWHVLASLCGGANGNTLSVNPTNPNDVLLAEVTPPGSNGYGTALYRSTDGGHTWTKQDITSVASLTIDTIGWAGSTAIVTLSPSESGGPYMYTAVLESIASGPLTRIDADGKIGGVTLDGPPAVTGSPGSLIFGCKPASGSKSYVVLVSGDHGTTWSEQHPWRYNGGDVTSVLFLDGGLVGVGQQGSTMVVSTDAGQTWQALPAFPSAGTFDGSQLLVTPDGTAYATSNKLNIVPSAGTADQTLYTAHVGGTAWSAALTLPTNAYPAAVTWDGQGHPLAIWANYLPDQNTPESEPIWHTLG